MYFVSKSGIQSAVQIILSICFLLIPNFSFGNDESLEEKRPPNILFFFVDDMGWQDTSVPFHIEPTELNAIYRTPNMERLAAQGIKFRQAYACAVCSPSRISLMTGMNSARHMVTNWTLNKDKQPDTDRPEVRAANWNLNGMCASPGIEHTIHATPLPQLLKQATYRTIHCGKAHFGANDTPGADPLTLGFDINIAGHAAGGPGSYYGTNNFSAAFRNGGAVWDVPGLKKYHGQDIYLNEALTREAITAIEKSVRDKTPFYLYMAHYAIHAPCEPDQRFVDNYKDSGLTPFQVTYASMIESMDKSLGDLMDCLVKNGIDNNTIIVFMSDNGAASHAPLNKPLRGHKLTPYEGGTRVPLIVRHPSMTKPATVCDKRYVIIEDIFPTFLEMAGVQNASQIGGQIDGESFVPLLNGEIASLDYERPIFWHFPNTYDQPPYSSVRSGDWKLIYQHTTQTLELYNLANDLSETKNLAESQPEKTRTLAQILSEHLRETKAGMTIKRSTEQPVPYPDEVKFDNQK